MIKKTIGRDGRLIKTRYYKWSEIENISVEKKLEGFGRNQRKKNYLIVTYKEKDRALNTMEINLTGLNTTIVKMDEAIKTYKKLYDYSMLYLN